METKSSNQDPYAAKEPAAPNSAENQIEDASLPTDTALAPDPTSAVAENPSEAGSLNTSSGKSFSARIEPCWHSLNQVSSGQEPGGGTKLDSDSGRSKNRKSKLGQILIAVGVLGCLGILFFFPLPVVIESPGPTFNVLGTLDSELGETVSDSSLASEDIIQISGTPTYDSQGELRMVTVSLRGGPGSYITPFETILALFRQGYEVYSESEVYPQDLTRDQIDKISQAQMDNSQISAEIAALSQLGYTIPGQTEVVGVSESSDALDKLEDGDIIQAVSVEGKQTVQLDEAASLYRVLEQVDPGTDLDLQILRGEETLNVTVKTSAPTDDRLGSILGIYVNTHPQFPVDISFSLQDVGGPSAGTMFALGIINRLTEEDITGGKVLAGTGAISYTGQVQAISGVPQKMLAAKAAGSQWFLLPSENCADVTSTKGITPVPVTTLKQALEVVEAIGQGQTDDLPTCPSN